MRRYFARVLGVVLTLLLGAAASVKAFTDADWFGLVAPTSGSRIVRALAVDTNAGVVYAGGSFANLNGLTVNNIARWNGTTWSNLGSGVNAAVFALALDGAGNLYVGGSFTNAGGVPARRIARWDGSAWSALGSGMNSNVQALAVDGAGTVFAGGAFTNAGGIVASNIAAWSGGAWSAFGMGQSGTPSTVNAMLLDPLGGLIVAGPASVGASFSRAVRWNGSTWTVLGPGFNNAVNALAYDPGQGILYAGGAFTALGNFGGMAVARVSSWNGVAWTNLGAGVNSTVSALAAPGPGRLLAGGLLTTAGGVSAIRIAEWDGSAWTNVGSGADGGILALTPGRQVMYVGGGFTNSGGQGAPYVAGLHVSVSLSALTLLGQDGVVIAHDAAPAGAGGTDLGPMPWGQAVTNTLFVTNGSPASLILSGVTTNGAGASLFRFLDLPASLAPGQGAAVRVVYAPTGAGVHTAAVSIVHNGTNSPFRINLRGTAPPRSQTITFPAIPDQAITSAVQLAATASSGLPVTFRIESGPGQIAGGTNLAFTAAGSVSVVAGQAGDVNWDPAPEVTNRVQVLARVAVEASPAEGGVVSGGGLYVPGVTQAMAAAASPGWAFTNWMDGEVLNPRDIVVAAQDAAYTANFIRLTATLAAIADPTNGGWVSGGGLCDVGTTQALVATATYGWAFTGWADGPTNAMREEIVPTNGAAFTALFTQRVCALTLVPEPAEGGAVLGAGAFAAGSTQQVTAAAAYGWAFDGWSDGATNNPYDVALPLDALVLTGRFTRLYATLGGQASPPQGGTVAGAGVVPVGATPTLAAASAPGWLFAGWSDGLVSTARQVVVPPAGTNFTARFLSRAARVAALSYDGDAAADLCVYSPAQGLWFIQLSSVSNAARQVQWGWTGTIPVPGDYDGDGLVDIAVFDPAVSWWFIEQTSTNVMRAENWGWTGTFPVPGDYDGDGRVDLAVYDRIQGLWFIQESHSGQMRIVPLQPRQVPVPGDYDGDGRTDPACYNTRSHVWTLQASGTNVPVLITWGARGVQPVPADYDGDGRTDVAVYHAASRGWYALASASGHTQVVHWGEALVNPVPGDYDGDGLADPGAYTRSAGWWNVLLSNGGQIDQNWGWNQAHPVLLQYWINREAGLTR